jgi:hypothetical protein
VDPADPMTWFTPIQDNGPAVMPGFYFYSAPGDSWQNPTSSAGHTNQIIPFYMKGVGADVLLVYANEVDAGWGAMGGYDGSYLDNTDLANALFYLLSGTTPVELASFELTSSDRQVAVVWETSFEENSFGFNVRRAEQGSSDFEQVNEQTIRSQGGHTSYQFVDTAVEPGVTYDYRLESLDLTGETETFTLGTVTVGRSPARQLALRQNTPNPFNPTTHIAFEMQTAGRATLEIFDASGRLVRTLVDGFLPAEAHSYEWDGRDAMGRAMSSGIYLYRLQVGDNTMTRKMTLMK